MRQCQRLHNVPGFGNATVGDNGNVFFLGHARAGVKRGELGNAHAGNNARGADGTGALANFDGIGAAVGEKFHAGGAGHVAGEQGQVRERVPQHPHRVPDAFGVSVGGRDRHDVHAAFHQGVDVAENAVAVEVAEGVAGG